MPENKRPIRILAAPAHYFITDKIGSEFYWSYGLMKSVTDLFKVRYTAITQVLPDVTQELEKITIRPVTSLTKPRFGFRDAFLFSWRCFLEGKKMLKEEHFDLIHHILPFGYEGSVNFLALFGYTKKIPFIIGPLQPPLIMTGGDAIGFHSDRTVSKLTGFNRWLFSFPLHIAQPLVKKLFAYTVRNCDALVVVNNYTRELYQRYISPQKIKVIPPGIDTKLFKYIPPQKKKEKEILAVGYLLKRKGLDYLIRAFSRLLKQYPLVKLRIIGHGPQLTALQQLTRELGIGEKVIFQGFVLHNHLAPFYQNCNIFCLPSLEESFGNVILEAMACGRPVVATRTVGAAGIIEDGETGFLVPIRDPIVLNKALLNLIKNRELRLKIGENGRRIIEQKYSWKVIAQQYYNLYEQLLKEQK